MQALDLKSDAKKGLRCGQDGARGHSTWEAASEQLHGGVTSHYTRWADGRLSSNGLSQIDGARVSSEVQLNIGG